MIYVEMKSSRRFISKTTSVQFKQQQVLCGSRLWRCWLGGRKGIRPVKTLSDGVLVWLSICLEQGADLHVAQLMPLTVSCFSKIQIGFTFLVQAHLGSPGQRAVNVLYGTEECGRAYFGICVYIIASAIRIIANFRTFQDIALRFPGISRSWKFYKHNSRTLQEA